MRRFKWLNERSFKIVNFEGDEKIVDYTNNFETTAFNIVPLILDTDNYK
jgi:hypothetical protein